MVRWQFRNRQFLSPNDWGTTGALHVDSPEYVDEVARSVRELGMGALTPADQLGIVNTAYAYLEGVLSLVGFISLVVASLGISNTLYMAIYERTREIGVWKAVGATKATVRTLFTLEAGAIGLLGGAAGLTIAWTVGQGINAVARATFAQDFASFALSAFPSWLVLAVLGFSVLIGVLAGLLPANRAAGLDPVAALRQE
jgi:ABC-type antimicrobial peptide transport system permease subunit